MSGIEWNDAGHPRSRAYDDTFYSSADGREECRHVFLGGNGLPGRWRDMGAITIAELGFGTGLNMLETWFTWVASRQPGQQLSLVSFERLMLDAGSIRRVAAHWPELMPCCETLLRELAARTGRSGIMQLDDQTTLTLIDGDCRTTLPDWQGAADCWYLDGFSPSKNPTMWALQTMREVYAHTRPGGTFATYASAGWVRRNLQEAGFEVERRAGFARKRHMSVGRRLG